MSLDNGQNESWVDYPEQQGFSLFMKERVSQRCILVGGRNES